MLSVRSQALLTSNQLVVSRSLRYYLSAKRRAFATVSPSVLCNPEPPSPCLSALDGNLLSALDTSRNHAPLSSIIHQYITQSGNILGVPLPYESRPTECRRPTLTQVHSGLVLVAHCVKDGSENKITLSSGFALEAPSPAKDETLILTCAHTLEEVG